MILISVLRCGFVRLCHCIMTIGIHS